jgi:DNA-binding CsgD family transcriptional regulator
MDAVLEIKASMCRVRETLSVAGVANSYSLRGEAVMGHMKNIMGKLGANHRAQALAIALRRGEIQL